MMEHCQDNLQHLRIATFAPHKRWDQINSLQMTSLTKVLQETCG